MKKIEQRWGIKTNEQSKSKGHPIELEGRFNGEKDLENKEEDNRTHEKNSTGQKKGESDVPLGKFLEVFIFKLKTEQKSYPPETEVHKRL